MDRFLAEQNAYSIIKKLVVLILVYDFFRAIIFSLGGLVYLGGHFSGTTIVYIAICLITRTPKGKMYYGSTFKAAVYLLLASNILNMTMKFIDIGIRQRYAVLTVILFTALISYTIGIITTKVNAKRSINKTS